MRRNQISSFVLNGPVHLNRRGASVQSTAGSRGVRISGNNAGYTVFRGSVKWNWLPTAFASFPFTSPLPVRHLVPSQFTLDSTYKRNIVLRRKNFIYFIIFYLILFRFAYVDSRLL